MRISDWSSDVCSSDLIGIPTTANIGDGRIYTVEGRVAIRPAPRLTLDGSIIYNDSRLSRPAQFLRLLSYEGHSLTFPIFPNWAARIGLAYRPPVRSEGNTSNLGPYCPPLWRSLLEKKKKQQKHKHT